MADDKCVPTGVFINSGRGDRFASFEDDDILPSPPTHDFPHPFKFQPRRSKFDTVFEDGKGPNNDLLAGQLETLEKRFANVRVTNAQTKLPSERFKQPFSQLFSARRGSLGVETSHTLGIEPESLGRPEMFEKPQHSGLKKVQVMAPMPRTDRRASDTNLLQTFKTSAIRRTDLALTKNTRQSVTEVKSKMEEKKTVQETPAPDVKPISRVDMTDGAQASKTSTMTSFGDWLFGGKKTVSVQNKDVNVFSPTSF